MLDALVGVLARRDGEIDPRILEHPLGVIGLSPRSARRRTGSNRKRIDRSRSSTPTWTCRRFMRFSFALEGRLRRQAASGAQAAPPQQFSMSSRASAFIAGIVGAVDERAVRRSCRISPARLSWARWKESELFGTPSASAIAPAAIPSRRPGRAAGTAPAGAPARARQAPSIAQSAFISGSSPTWMADAQQGVSGRALKLDATA